MKKLLLLFLWLFIISCTNEWTEYNINIIKKDYEVVETLDNSCIVNSDCITPSIYMTQSHCPYSSKCINLQCSVIYPKPFVGRKIESNIIPIIDKIIESCNNNWWNWLEKFHECEYISKSWCTDNWWKFYNCTSACRNNPNTEECTEQCVSLCSFYD